VFEGARPRPVHIEIPLDVLVEPADHLLPGRVVRSTRAGAAPQAVAQMAERLANARRPLILAGGGALAAGAALARLAEQLQAPVALTINAKGLLPASHPLQIGSTQSLPATRALVAEADVVLAIGTELAETDYDVTFKGGFEIPGSLLRIDIDPDQTVRNYLPALSLVADAELAAEALLGALQALPQSVREHVGRGPGGQAAPGTGGGLGPADLEPDASAECDSRASAQCHSGGRFDPAGVHRQPDPGHGPATPLV